MSSPAPDVLTLLPPDMIRRHRVVPLASEANTLEVGTDRPPSPALLRDLAFVSGRSVVPVPMDSAAVDAFLATYLPEISTRPVRAASPPSFRAAGGAAAACQGSVVRQLDRLIARAIDARASDVHIEPYAHRFRVRFRLDGVLHTAQELLIPQKEALVSRLKIMAGLDIAEKRRPQDGRIRFAHEERSVDLRVSTLPTDFGEKVVLRLLDQHHLQLDLDALGFDAERLDAFREAIHTPHGIVLVTGPTGSGKTTTLYAALNALNTPEVNITTIEDPIEYNLPGINQTHVRADIGFTFAQALRAFLRQDPDIVMVGEIRDAETARIAVRAALTGHLVLSTVHANDAASTVTRLVDMGVEPFLVASSLRLVVAQRLVRRVCPGCRKPRLPDALPADRLGLDDAAVVVEGEGCAACHGTGYRGRTAVFEVLRVSETMAASIGAGAGTLELRRRARSEGTPSLREAALRKVRDGVTTPEEALRETML